MQPRWATLTICEGAYTGLPSKKPLAVDGDHGRAHGKIRRPPRQRGRTVRRAGYRCFQVWPRGRRPALSGLALGISTADGQ
jgi:hypothetical protein